MVASLLPGCASEPDPSWFVLGGTMDPWVQWVHMFDGVGWV